MFIWRFAYIIYSVISLNGLRNRLILPWFSSSSEAILRLFIRFFTRLREITGKKEETLSFPDGEEVTIERIVKNLADKHGRAFSDYVYRENTREVRGFLQFLINGKHAAEGLETRLDDGDVLAILPPVGGG